MKITKAQLKQIIKEEISKAIKESKPKRDPRDVYRDAMHYSKASFARVPGQSYQSPPAGEKPYAGHRVRLVSGAELRRIKSRGGRVPDWVGKKSYPPGLKGTILDFDRKDPDDFLDGKEPDEYLGNYSDSARIRWDDGREEKIFPPWNYIIKIGEVDPKEIVTPAIKA